MRKITDIFKHKTRISVLCPFHEERTPSCLIDIKKEELSCVGCGKQAKLSDLSTIDYACIMMDIAAANGQA